MPTNCLIQTQNGIEIIELCLLKFYFLLQRLLIVKQVIYKRIVFALNLSKMICIFTIDNRLRL